ncbi:thiazole synthase [Paraglaciecola sp. L3A3]|uniref:thiazole synthase n=1 Tax=Paraglaciecola sp. L3A3 TaxID=2686358 RepID=UPI00131B3CFC|nr:thiazole synthase [Paraglaciecola sp. L3A3]
MLTIANHSFGSRLFSGTGKFANTDTMLSALQASGSELVTLAIKRIDRQQGTDNLMLPLTQMGVKLLPNTSGARNAEEAIFAAQLAQQMFATNWVKLEIHPDPKYLMPDPIETLIAAEALVKQGFVVLPYVHADPVLCHRLEEVGCSAVMPLASPIGSNQGLLTREFLQIIIEQAKVPVVIDAGIGSPSDATAAMELGADAVLVNTAIASSRQPIVMAQCFKQAVKTGHDAYQAGLGQVSNQAQNTSPLTGFLRQPTAIAGAN